MRIGHLELYVSDPGRARAFYEEVLGFEVVAEQEGGFHWLALGGTEVLLRPGGSAGTAASYGEASEGIVLYTDDLEGTVAELTARGLEFEGRDGSDRCLTFRDPDGHWFQLVDPGDHGA
jgi:catechol 2,3-dioxygenase-like lactoylglutathione lyase family enzyme